MPWVRRLNDFTLLEDDSVAEAYRDATVESSYLSRVGQASTSLPRAIRSGETLNREVVLSAYARSYDPQPRVTILLDGKSVLDETKAGAHRISLSLSPGKHRLELIVRDKDGRIAGKQTLPAGTL